MSIYYCHRLNLCVLPNHILKSTPSGMVFGGGVYLSLNEVLEMRFSCGFSDLVKIGRDMAAL